MKTSSSIFGIVLRSSATLMVIMGASAIGAFATLGDGNIKRSENPKNTSLFSKSSYRSNSFSLRPNISFRGNQVINTHQPDRFINLNTVVTYQQGNTTFVMPLKKKVILNDRVVFNPNAAARNSR